MNTIRTIITVASLQLRRIGRRVNFLSNDKKSVSRRIAQSLGDRSFSKDEASHSVLKARFQNLAHITIIAATILLAHCNFNVDKPSDLPFLANFAKGSAKYSVVCEADSPSTATKSLKGTVKDYQTGAVISNARIATDPATTNTTSDTSGAFTVSAIDSSVTSITVNISAAKYNLFSAKIKLTCQNSRMEVLLDSITISATGVNSCIVGTSKMDGCNIQ